MCVWKYICIHTCYRSEMVRVCIYEYIWMGGKWRMFKLLLPFVTCTNLVFAFTCKIEQDHLNRPTRNCAGIQTLHIGSGVVIRLFYCCWMINVHNCHSDVALLRTFLNFQVGSPNVPEGHNHLRRVCIERSSPQKDTHTHTRKSCSLVQCEHAIVMTAAVLWSCLHIINRDKKNTQTKR